MSLMRPGQRRETESSGQRDMGLNEGRGHGDDEGGGRLDGTGWLIRCERRAGGSIKDGAQVSGSDNCLDRSSINEDKSTGGTKISWGRQ